MKGLPHGRHADLDSTRERLARACRVLGRLDLTKAATGHASARIPGTDRLLIRARGANELGVRHTTSDQILEVDRHGTVVESDVTGLTAPLEVFIHTELYRRRADIAAIVHMHPPIVVAFTACDIPLLPIYGAYDPRSAQLAIDGIPTYPRSILIDSAVLGAELAETMGSSSVCLMRGHGATTAAGNIEDAALEMIYLNELATMNYHARLLGGPKVIPRQEQALIGALERSPTRGIEPVPSSRSAALWRYYCMLTGA